PEVWSDVFKPHGVDRRSVLNTKGVELRTVVQLVVGEEVSIVTERLTAEGCGKCGHVKYLPVVRGQFPALRQMPSGAIAKTREYFGSGKQADQRIVISQEVVRSLVAKSVRGASLTPVEPRQGP